MFDYYKLSDFMYKFHKYLIIALLRELYKSFENHIILHNFWKLNFIAKYEKKTKITLFISLL
jgi:hypothetical protein